MIKPCFFSSLNNNVITIVQPTPSPYMYITHRGGEWGDFGKPKDSAWGGLGFEPTMAPAAQLLLSTRADKSRLNIKLLV